MKILIVDTGRGGEQVVITPIINAYRRKFPDAFIKVATCPQYESLYRSSYDVNEWCPIRYEVGDHYANDPVGAAASLIEESRSEFDICENISEMQLDINKSMMDNCYERIVDKHFDFEFVEKRVFVYPTDAEKEMANRILDNNNDIILISHGANSAAKPLKIESYETLAEKLKNFGTVMYVGTRGRLRMASDPEIKNAKPLWDLSYGTLFALADRIRLFLCLDSAPGFLVSNSPCPIISLRKFVPCFPLTNTGLVANHLRTEKNTYELEFFQESQDEILDRVMKCIEENIHVQLQKR